VPSPGATTGALLHQALFYSDRASFIAGTLPFIREGVDAGDAVLVVIDAPKIELLQDALGEAAPSVQFADMHQVGRNPARIIPEWRAFVDRNVAQGRAVRGIGEPVHAARSSVELSECHLHEALLNVAFHDGPVWPLLCPYDTTILSSETVERARHTHPLLRDSDAADSTPSGMFAHDHSCTTLLGEPLSARPADHVPLEFDGSSVREVRRLVGSVASRVGFTSRRTDDLVLASSEVATNSVMYGGGSGEAIAWVDDASIVVEIADAGLVVDPLVGRVRPAEGVIGGRGLWLANALCDLVQIRTRASGTVVRLHMSRH
jgi:anti-sigma regulatory factor (Ser/Thr protein kinase)